MLRLQADSTFIGSSVVTLWNSSTVFTVWAKPVAQASGIEAGSNDIGQVDVIVDSDEITRENAAQAIGAYARSSVTIVD